MTHSDSKRKASMDIRRINALIGTAIDSAKKSLPPDVDADDFLYGIESAIWGGVAIVANEIMHGRLTAQGCMKALNEHLEILEDRIEGDECDD